MRSLRLWGPVAVYVAAVTVLSHRPVLPLPGAAPDWLAHAVEFGVLAALTARALSGSGLAPTPRVVACAMAACAIFGAVDEFHQSFVPGRDSTASDAAADTVGASLVLAVWALGARWASRARRPVSTGAQAIEVVLVGRAACHLCDEAERTLGEVLPEYGARLVKLDVDQDRELKTRFGDQVPVVLIEGRKMFKYRVDQRRLRRRLDTLCRRVAP